MNQESIFDEYDLKLFKKHWIFNLIGIFRIINCLFFVFLTLIFVNDLYVLLRFDYIDKGNAIKKISAFIELLFLLILFISVLKYSFKQLYSEIFLKYLLCQKGLGIYSSLTVNVVLFIFVIIIDFILPLENIEYLIISKIFLSFLLLPLIIADIYYVISDKIL